MSVIRLRNYEKLINLELAHYWKLNGNANDSKGTAHGTLINAPTLVTGKLGDAYSLNGIDQYIDIPDSINIGQSFSISLWIKSNAATWESSYAFFINSRAANGFMMGPTGDFSFVRCYVAHSDGNLSISYVDIPNPADITLWNHYAMVYDHSTNRQKGYLNGVLMVDVQHAAFIRNNDTAPALIGKDMFSNETNRHGNVQIDDVAIFGKALSTEEIEYIYNSGTGREL